MSFETIRLERAECGIATLTLACPERHNAINSQMIDDLSVAAMELEKNTSVRVVIIAAEGRSFCAGADLGWMKKQFAASREERIIEASRFAAFLQAINSLSKPVIGKVQGQAFGGGLGLMAVCDEVIANEEAKFGFTETKLGIIPATISPYVFAKMGEGKARQVFMSGRVFTAIEAVDLGLVSTIASEGELDAVVHARAEPYLKAAPTAVAAAKRLVRDLGAPINQAIIDDTISRLADAWECPEALEGIGAFFAKRQPAWIQPASINAE